MEANNPYSASTFSISGSLKDVSIQSQFTYFPIATTSDPCSATNPWNFYAGNELLYSIVNTSTGVVVKTFYMSKFLEFYNSSVLEKCLNNSIPSDFEGIFRDTSSVVLSPGNYEIRLYGRHLFNNYASLNFINRDRIVDAQNGLYAKVAGGIRIREIASRSDLTSPELIRKYEYTTTVNNEKYSTGKLMLYPGYHIPFYCVEDGTDALFLSSYIGRSWSNVPLGTSASGSIVGYDLVRELVGQEGEGGITEYHFVNQVEESDLVTIDERIEGVPTRQNTGNGLLSEKRIFDSEGKIIKSETNVYTRQMAKEIASVASRRIIRKKQGQTATLCGRGRQYMILKGYSIPTGRWVKSYSIDKNSDPVADRYVEVRQDFVYDEVSHLQLKSSKTTNSHGQEIEEKFYYPNEVNWIPSGMWQDGHMYDKIVLAEKFVDEQLIHSKKNIFSLSSDKYVLSERQESILSNDFETLSQYTYTNSGNIRAIRNRDGLFDIYVWGYSSNYLLSVVRNISLVQFYNGLGVAGENEISAFENEITPSVTFRNKINALRNIFPSSIVRSFDYSPLIGIREEENENGKKVYYEYDNLNRLALVKDNDNNILKRVCYNFSGQESSCKVFYNTEKSGYFTRNCGTGYNPAPYLYVVAQGKYVADTQVAADALAQADLEANGQAQADANSVCPTVYPSAPISEVFYSNICPPNHVPAPYQVNLPQGFRYSLISVADANALARDHAQLLANDFGECEYIPLVYARLEIEAGNPHNNSSGSYFESGQFVNVYVRFYSDQACTVPFTLTSSVNFSIYNVGYWESDAEHLPHDYEMFDAVVQAGVSSYLILNNHWYYGLAGESDGEGGLVYYEKWKYDYYLSGNEEQYILRPTVRSIQYPSGY